MSKTQPKPEEIANKFRDKYEQVYQAKFAELKSQGKTEEEAESLASKEGIAAAASTLTEAEISICVKLLLTAKVKSNSARKHIGCVILFTSSTQPAPTSPQANLPVDPVQQKALEEAKAKQQASSTTAPVPTTGVDELKTKAALSAFETALKEKESGINPRQNFIEAWNAIGDHKNTIRAAAKAGTSPEAKLIMDTVAQLLPEEKTAALSSSQITTQIVPDATKAPVATTSQHQAWLDQTKHTALRNCRDLYSSAKAL